MTAKKWGKKIKVGIIGTGNIGSDLLVKIMRSKYIECSIFTGQNPDSHGIKRAKALGIKTSYESIKVIEKNPKVCSIVFDATSARAHEIHAPILKKLGIYAIDMTPSRIGKMCIPIINLEDGMKAKNVNMITCGGQATTPIINVIMKIHPEIKYIEIVSSVASKSAGIGTRDNIDEYTQTTSEGIMHFTGVKEAKTIIILNPADPPIYMHNTIYASVENPKINLIRKKFKEVVSKIQKYVPGYKLIVEPIYTNGLLTTMVEVVGRGDYLPVYAGNLDIINCTAIVVAEEYAKRKLMTS
ncbi:acetaldehyde dehydrogenase (acetylating) [Candidatus Roizmanbacteria bacterium RIFCSPLOWO2_01_FULL_38_12]|uniref:Acetaldehyde dehydrogenase n=1 Tax=Candidatus Roizmanbacteria bacterium RIFCSPLOWO2_01_FULL_38_12 TaxID=1802061 RepID=A0A1F7IUJ4_9BACT|nr:MAG: acetaldehyde dehydrogenase (acetylating) [Candidatus Roizmanbacteria bacterium RIFCSPHIGHO2_01_FULL_38_15]OGK34335.1 MAG: acetaldehyde dehydrogenase (acetylating) [Candidatus Roizmanbacteria bacterium RIFCSPHIGHO2_12_FULL_38_13]OGK47023.1 MAG: acetaldehyde dehydrogenase (acetylating) [Candidatus Roizmanbacteria bacterium RIFCSPLOWO2_01_FULL_38_12]